MKANYNEVRLTGRRKEGKATNKKAKAILTGILIWIAVIALIICVCVFKPVAVIVAAAALVFLLIIIIMAIYDYVR